MLEKALYGDRRYYTWLGVLVFFILMGLGFYLWQYFVGLGLTGMSRDVSWGLYISQLTFLVGVAASAVLLVLPYYLHDYKAFGRITIFGEFLAVPAIIMCMTFVLVDLGRPMRLLNVMRYPTPNSILFWDVVVLSGYLGLNLIIGYVVLTAERKQIKPPDWIKPLIYISIPWAVSIHTVTAFLYAGLPGRHMWLTAIMAARFLSSAFAAGPALLIIALLIIKRVSTFDPGEKAIGKLAVIITYAAIINMFFFALEFFTAFYSGIPGHQHSLAYLFWGLEGKGILVPWMWTSVILGFGAIILLLIPRNRRNETMLIVLCAILFVSLWIDKGLGLVVGGFIPNPLEHVHEYSPTGPEIMITLGIWALGFLLMTILYKIAVGVKEETGGELAPH